MKAKILTLLKTNAPEYVSGEDISDSLGVSRTAIWKHIKALRDEGYIVESHPRVGYRLCGMPDRLYPEVINEYLKTKTIGSGIVHFGKTTSTNDIAKELAQSGALEGTVVIAEEQTGGRGRMGRAWYSKQGDGIWASIILRPEQSPSEAPKITLLTAVALVKSLAKSGVNPGIKWPNDIMINGKKIAGVLTEMNAEMDRINYIVVGFGLNVNAQVDNWPVELRETATSLHTEKGFVDNRAKLLAEVLFQFEEQYLNFKNGRFDLIAHEWRCHSATMGKLVRVVIHSQVFEGTAIDIDEDGSLLVECEGGVRKVISGEVFLI